MQTSLIVHARAETGRLTHLTAALIAGDGKLANSIALTIAPAAHGVPAPNALVALTALAALAERIEADGATLAALAAAYATHPKAPRLPLPAPQPQAAE